MTASSSEGAWAQALSILLSARDLRGSVHVTSFVCGWRNGRRLHLRVGQLALTRSAAERAAPFQRVMGKKVCLSLRGWLLSCSPGLRWFSFGFGYESHRVLTSSASWGGFRGDQSKSFQGGASGVEPPQVHGKLSRQGHGGLFPLDGPSALSLIHI